MAIKTYLTPTEIKDMVEAAPYLRDEVCIKFLADTGVRVSEFLGVRVENIDFDKRLVMIPHLKVGIRKHCPNCNHTAGTHTKFCANCAADLSKVPTTGKLDRTRVIPLGQDTLDKIKEYLEARPEKSDYLMPLTRRSIYNIVKMAAEKAGLSGKVILNPETGKRHFIHPHSFRDALAVDWFATAPEGYTEDESRKALQTQLGHVRYETTVRYQKLSPDTARDIGDIIREKRFGDRKTGDEGTADPHAEKPTVS